MRVLFGALLVVGAVFFVGKNFLKDADVGISLDWLLSGSPETAAERRVKQVLEGLKLDGDGESTTAFQAAICQWDSGVNVLSDRDELEQAYDNFDRWRDAGGINHRKLTSYTIDGSEIVQDEPPVVNVTGTIEGRPFEVRVPYERPISWIR
ncbi:MAG TPA: hypothetical protein VJ725_05875 [Thermoanaerobaculia bacterium]|nr:hypothetical protein [Thermoanaerobaculia bacterium]